MRQYHKDGFIKASHLSNAVIAIIIMEAIGFCNSIYFKIKQ